MICQQTDLGLCFRKQKLYTIFLFVIFPSIQVSSSILQTFLVFFFFLFRFVCKPTNRIYSCIEDLSFTFVFFINCFEVSLAQKRQMVQKIDWLCDNINKTYKLITCFVVFATYSWKFPKISLLTTILYFLSLSI